MINRTNTLKIIKAKVDARKTTKVKMKRHIWTAFTEGVFKTSKRRRVKELFKQGNSIMWVDDVCEVRNINMLDTETLHIILWQLISDKEKREIALEHLLTTKTYLED